MKATLLAALLALSLLSGCASSDEKKEVSSENAGQISSEEQETEETAETADTEKDNGQGLLPGKAQTKTDRIDEKCIQSHAGSLGIGNVCNQSHHESTDDGGNNGSEKNSAPFHVGFTENSRINGDDISHGKKSSQTCRDLCGDCRSIFTQLKKAIHNTFPSFFSGHISGIHS